MKTCNLSKKLMLNGLAATAFASSITAVASNEVRYAKGLIVPRDASYGVPFLTWNDPGELPDRIDLRESGHVTPVRNQGSCGSCWAFAGAAVMETAMLRSSSNELNVSEQELVSCDRNSYGCRGGWQPFAYMVKNGIGSEADFPYKAKDLSCKDIPAVAKAVSWTKIGAPDRRPTDDEMRRAVQDFGAVWVAVAADSSWHNPKPINTACSNGSINHAVTIVGYEKDDAGKFNFIVKNSWGSGWNGDGYIKSRLGCDSLGKHATVVVPADSACIPPEFGLGKTLTLRGGGDLSAPGLDAAGMTYSWRRVGKPMPINDDPRRIGPSDSGDYIVTTQNGCGTWEMMVKVKTY